jgi:hypothetical protein
MLGDCHLASGDLCRESAPLGQGRRASLLVDLPRDEMALLIELVVHLGMNSAELLQRAYRGESPEDESACRVRSVFVALALWGCQGELMTTAPALQTGGREACLVPRLATAP